ncbi:MAG: hypothetical protein AAF585_06030, partial [Verrucomicrobiota bacterium]
WTHMFIMPLVDLYATACHWLVNDYPIHLGLKWFLIASFFNGVVIEIGRKLRRPEDEEEGVRTYTVVWGVKRAPWVWIAMLAATTITASLAAIEIGFVVPVVCVLGSLLAAAIFFAARFTRHVGKHSGKIFENFAGAWTIALYLILGLIPYFLAA